MKLLMISGDRSVLSGKRGAFRYTLEEFSKQWERIDVICPSAGTADRGLRSLRSSAGQVSDFSNVFFHPSPWPLFFQQKWIRIKGTALVAQHHHDVMTVHEYPPFYNGFGAARVHRQTGIPYALEIHHIVGFPVAASFAEYIGRIMTRTWIASDAARAARVRVVNHEVKRVLADWHVPAEKISVVPSFYLDAAVLTPDPSIEKTYDVVTSARLVENKGLREVMDAVSRLPEAKVLIIGDGPLRQILQRTAGPNVTFLGWLPDQVDVMRAVQSGKIFVMNSKSEGGPRSALEAMALGMPVISTKVGVMPEVIRDGENGIFTDGSPDDLAQKISALLGDEAWRDRLGREARKITERFERRKLIKDYADFLKSLVP